ncbi:hypothetical protein F5888DRAFT_704230 [Russula emetica]|nr:hypothetical protein F5888DRAFT_704230 [Russula emetica]
MESSTATLASLKVLLQKSPTLQTLHRSLRTSQLHCPSAGRSCRYDQSMISTIVCSAIIGGSLSRPTDRISDTLGNSEFLRKHPYFLPCAVSAGFSAFVWIFTFVFLRETVPYPKTLRDLLIKEPEALSSVGHSEIDDAEKRYPLRQLVTS